MAYNITLTNGTSLISGGLPDGTIDTANTSLTLVGKNYPGYGLFLNQDFVRLMENFANGSAPAAPLPGQIWWDSNNKYLKINTSSTKGTASAVWKPMSTFSYSSSAPSNPVNGEQWYDTVNGQLKVYAAGSWITIGPAATSATGNSGAIPNTVTAISPAATYVVLQFYVDNNLVGIWSKENTFTTSIPGFSTVRKGLNLNTTLNQAFYGNSEVALGLLVGTSTIPAASFLRNDTSGAITGALSVTGDLTAGPSSDFEAVVSSGTVTLRNQTNNKDLILSLKTGSIQTPFFRGNYQTGLAEAYNNPTVSSPPLSYATKDYVDNILSGGTGTTSFNANVTPTANLTYSLGSSSLWWANVWAGTFRGTSITAQYADLAERFESDYSYSPGTVVSLGGPKEITKVVDELSEDVFGVISTRAAYLMNDSAGSNETHPPVAVSGRVPVKVIGKIKKGDRLVSAGNGLARAANKNEMTPWNVIGRSLENKLDTGEGTVEAIVKLNS